MSGLELLDVIRDHLDLLQPVGRPTKDQAMDAEAELRELLKAIGRLTR